MTRLYSFFGLYTFVLGAPFFSLGAFILFYIIAYDQAIVALIPVAAMMMYWLFTFRRWKKVYYERGSLYIQDVFSSNQIIVHKENIGSINRLMSYDPRFYKIVYYDENKDAKSVYFQRNLFLSNFSDIIDKLNA
jgi:hypothetical protein